MSAGFRTTRSIAAAALVASGLASGCGSRWEATVRRAPPDTFVLADTDAGGDTDTDSAADPDTDVLPTGDACYPGGDRAWETCLPVVTPSPMPPGYDYPPPLAGSAQYRAPIAFLDLATADPATRLAPNFTLSEVAQEWKGRYAVIQPHAIARLQELRDHLGPLVINSGYRSPDYNASVGGAGSSRHMYGDAFDIDPVDVSLDALHAACEDAGAGYVGVYTTHIHCDWRDDPVDPVFFGSARTTTVAPRPHLDAVLQWRGDVLTAPAEGWDEGEPLREWVALDRAGRVLDTEVAEVYAPPSDAVRVEVTIGRALVRTLDLPRPVRRPPSAPPRGTPR